MHPPMIFEDDLQPRDFLGAHGAARSYPLALETPNAAELSPRGLAV